MCSRFFSTIFCLIVNPWLLQLDPSCCLSNSVRIRFADDVPWFTNVYHHFPWCIICQWAVFPFKKPTISANSDSFLVESLLFLVVKLDSFWISSSLCVAYILLLVIFPTCWCHIPLCHHHPSLDCHGQRESLYCLKIVYTPTAVWIGHMMINCGKSWVVPYFFMRTHMFNG